MIRLHASFAAFVLVLAMATTDVLAQEIEITAFNPESRTLEPGDTAFSELSIRNRSRSGQTVWIGYSVQAPTGDWYDVPAREIPLRGRGRETVRLGWQVPAATSGEYRVVMAAWSGVPGAENSVRLASRDQTEAFRVRLPGEPAVLWRAASHRLGRGTLRAEAVEFNGGGFRLHLPLASCDGAEVRTVDRLGYGEYTIRMKTPFAPGSLSAFFLYQDTPGDTSDEIDIEIHNDGSRRILLTAWIAGKQVRNVTLRLPFNPAEALHDYSIRWSPEALEFLVDGASVARWTRNFPHNRMRLASNVWWPNWLKCGASEELRTLEIESIAVQQAE